MILQEPLKSDPEKYTIGCDSRDLRRLYEAARDVQIFGRIVEGYAESGKHHHSFWDSEMAAVGRITAALMEPFKGFFIAAINAEGDIAVDRTRDRKERERREEGYRGPPRPEDNIVCFHAPAGTQAPDHAGQREHEEELSFTEHREAFKGVDFGGEPAESRILWALYRNHIHSIEKLARIPATELLDCRRIGEKTLGQIRAALKSNGIASEAWGMPEAATRQGN
jgi:hypothetical protein